MVHRLTFLRRPLGYKAQPNLIQTIHHTKISFWQKKYATDEFVGDTYQRILFDRQTTAGE